MKPRDYQIEAAEALHEKGAGQWLICLPTGAGKSFLMSLFKRQGRLLILVHREDLMYSNGENFSCSVGYEKAELSSNGEDVIIASVQSLMNRLDKFSPDDFDMVIADEAHHYTSAEYSRVLDYFKPRQRVGLTATANRADGVGLESIFSEIIYEKDIQFMIENGYLSPVKCYKVDIGYDISSVAKRMGDFAIAELERQVNIEGANNAIKELVEKYDGSTIIACVNVKHAEDLAEYCGGVAVTADTPNRMQILEDYKSGKISLLTTVNVLSEGSNLPIAKNLIMAAPTQSSVKYIQLAGRVMRLHEQKDFCRIIDCVGNMGRHQICGSHTLLGLDLEEVPKSAHVDLIGDLIDDLPELIKKKADCPQSWINNIKTVELFSKKNNWNTHNVNYFKHPDGSMIVSLADGKWIGITPPDHVGKSRIITSKGAKYDAKPTQDNFDEILQILKTHAKDESPLWNTKSIKRWGKAKATSGQINYANALLRNNNWSYRLDANCSKSDASCVINRLKKNALTQPKRRRHNGGITIRFKSGPSVQESRIC